MLSLIQQTRFMVRANLASLPRRLPISLSMVFSVTLVVCVLCGFLSMAKGFERALTGAGSPLVAVVLGGGTTQEIASDIPAEAIRTLQAMPGDIGAVRDPNGALMMSRELVTFVEARQRGDGAERTLALRGMDASGPSLRDRARLSAGRLFTPGAREIVVGARIADEFRGLGVGRTVRFGAVDWTVVGQFSANGSAFESEIWADLDAVRAAFDRQGQVQSLRLRLKSTAGLTPLQEALAAIPGAPLVAVSEADLYAAQSERTSRLIRLFGWPIALLMAIGATAGALNTMMTSVSDRTVEIATVRALGFSPLSAFVATWVEAMVLAAAGAAIGLLASWLAFNGWQASTVGANNARMAFQLSVSGDVLRAAGLLGLAVGIVGGAIPAVVAARVPLIRALRARG